MYQIRQASVSDLDLLYHLERRHAQEESHGHWQSEPLSRQLLSQLLSDHVVVFAIKNQTVIAYGVAADWQMMTAMPLYKKGHAVAKRELGHQGLCHWGPVWVQPQDRGHGLCSGLFEAALTLLPNHYRSLQAIVAEDNEASYQAHSRHNIMTVASYFSDQGQDYYLLNRQR
ncbi:GNAT family N-acetyltransferase [Shewanella sp. NIFS-20-20]|uniref:GNAT family N-acetyltransferase n=1 Tax=Shewanella sp. NIFS-20-20 TaxID=2853806 RepID=UPI001C43B498|nr:GNAT family N-acetyltransferase [Shewanella sp. NIFS-20-20]MBV7316980.1 GNAT family N-acetyltransferase [Shewanella sp. NIFS-20-20]